MHNSQSKATAGQAVLHAILVARPFRNLQSQKKANDPAAVRWDLQNDPQWLRDDIRRASDVNNPSFIISVQKLSTGQSN